MNPNIKWLRDAADEIAKEGHAGWGNTCSQAADAFESLERELAAARKDAEVLKAGFYQIVHFAEQQRISVEQRLSNQTPGKPCMKPDCDRIVQPIDGMVPSYCAEHRDYAPWQARTVSEQPLVTALFQAVKMERDLFNERDDESYSSEAIMLAKERVALCKAAVLTAMRSSHEPPDEPSLDRWAHTLIMETMACANRLLPPNISIVADMRKYLAAYADRAAQPSPGMHPNCTDPCPACDPPSVSYCYPLFEHMSKEHGLTLIDSELNEIVRVVASLAQPPSDWQPIETAPKGGKWVLVWWPTITDQPFVAYQVAGVWHAATSGDKWSDDPGPTHWTPLISPPITKDGD